MSHSRDRLTGWLQQHLVGARWGSEVRVVPLAYKPRNAEIARFNLRWAGVADRAEVVVGAELDTLPISQSRRSQHCGFPKTVKLSYGRFVKLPPPTNTTALRHRSTSAPSSVTDRMTNRSASENATVLSRSGRILMTVGVQSKPDSACVSLNVP